MYLLSLLDAGVAGVSTVTPINIIAVRRAGPSRLQSFGLFAEPPNHSLTLFGVIV